MRTHQEALEEIRIQCQFTRGEEHVDAMVEALLEHPSCFEHPFVLSVAEMNPILRKAVERWRGRLREIEVNEVLLKEKQRPGWLLEVARLRVTPTSLLAKLIKHEASEPQSLSPIAIAILIDAFQERESDVFGKDPWRGVVLKIAGSYSSTSVVGWMVSKVLSESVNAER